MSDNAPPTNFVSAWIGAGTAALIAGAGYLVGWGRMSSRMDSVEARVSKVEGDLKEQLDDIKETMNSQHERIRHDLNNQNTIMLGIAEEKGRNEARHEENRRALDAIARRLEKLAT